MKNYFLDRAFPDRFIYICSTRGCGKYVEEGERLICRDCREAKGLDKPTFALIHYLRARFSKNVSSK